MSKPITVNVPTLERIDADRRAHPLDYYVPHVGQLPFHKSTAKIRALFGGNRSGKTTATKAEVSLFATHSQKYRSRPMRPLKILCGSESNEYNRDIIVPKLHRFIPANMIVDEVRIGRGFIDFWKLRDGTIIKFKNYEQDVDKWAGDDYDLIDLDEEPPYNIWVECKMRTIDRGGEILLGMTPVNGMTFIFTDIWEKRGSTGIEAWLMDMDLNPYLNQKDKELVLIGLTEQEKRVRKEGKFVALTGLIYGEDFNRKFHVKPRFKVPDEWPVILGIDPHLRTATRILWVTRAPYKCEFLNRGDWLAFDELIVKGLIPEIVDAIFIKNNNRKIRASFADPALNIKDNIMGVNPFDEFANCGLPLEKANKVVQSGIFEIRKLLRETPPGLYMFDDMTNLIYEFEHYSYADPPDIPDRNYNENIRKKDDHLLDDLRYVVNSGLPPTVVRDYHPHTAYQYSETGRIIGVANA